MPGEWITKETLALLAQRRAEGVGFAVIAREIGNGCTKNAAIGAARRAGHPHENRVDANVPWSPAEVAILRDNARLLMRGLAKLLPGRTPAGIQRKRRALNLVGPSLGRPDWSRVPVRRAPVPTLATVVAARTPPQRLAPVVIPPPGRGPLPVARLRRCAFPIGTPGQVDFRWCDAAIERPGPYCEDCRKICYVRLREPREEEAA